MGFGEKLAEYRKRSHIRQDEFADLLRMNRSHLNQIERGKVNPPRLETIILMIGLLKLSPDEAIELLFKTGQVQNSESILTVANIESLVKSLEAFEVALQAIQPLLVRLKGALDAAKQSLQSELIV